MKIEKGIPIPAKKTGSKRNPLFDQLEVGDSILVNSKEEANRVRQSLLKRNFKAVQRKQGDQIRIWRIA